MKEYSVVATSYNDENNIEKFIENIREFSEAPSEIVIVDGGSTDSTQNKLVKSAANIGCSCTFVFDGKRRNISEGYNEAIQKAVSDVVLILGIGNVYDRDYAKNLLLYMEKSDVDIAYGPFLGVDANHFSSIFNKAFIKGNKKYDYGQASNRGALVKKKVFAIAGYFYEGFIYAGEDTEFYSRVKKFGVKQGYVSSATVYWESPLTISEYAKKMKVNAIADMQMLSVRNIVIKSVMPILSILLIPLLFMVHWILLIAYILFLFAVSFYKTRSCEFLPALLWLSNFYILAYFYVKDRKYMKKEYHLKENT